MKNQVIQVLRLGHRPTRDKRVTSHLLLAGRAFGATSAFYSGVRDLKIEEGIESVDKSWGGSFKVKYVESWRDTVNSWKKRGGETIHLTMYGVPLQNVIKNIKASTKEKMIIVGGAKVARRVFEIADWNVAITSQPHSEVSALAVFLHELLEGMELLKLFDGAKIRISPQAKGKKVISTI